MAANAEFSGKVAIVTGSSAGIGAHLAIELARRGAYVVLTGTSRSKLENITKLCVEAGQDRDNILAVEADFVSDEAVKNVVDQTINKFGTIHYLVNNAGIAMFGNFQNTSVESLENMMNINVRAAFYITQLCAPYLIQNKGSIVNVSSVGGIACAPPVHAYGISKGCLIFFTRALALELGPKGVRVNSISPSTILGTDIFVRPWGKVRTKEEMAKVLAPQIKTVPLGRLGELHDTTSAILFFLSEDSSFATGVNLRLDGGTACYLKGVVPPPK